MKKLYNFIIFLCVSINMGLFAMERIPSSQGSSISMCDEVARKTSESKISESRNYSHAYLSQCARKAAEDNDLAALKEAMNAWKNTFDNNEDGMNNNDDDYWATYLECNDSLTMLQKENKRIVDQHKMHSKNIMLALKNNDLQKAENIIEKWALLFDKTRKIKIVSDENYFLSFVTYKEHLVKMIDMPKQSINSNDKHI